MESSQAGKVKALALKKLPLEYFILRLLMLWIDHLIIVVFGLVLPLRLLFSAKKGSTMGMRFNTQNKLILYYSNSLVLWLMTAVIVFTWYFSGRSMDALGLEWGKLPYSLSAWLTLLVFLVLYGADAMLEVISPAQQEATRKRFQQKIGFLPANAPEFTHYVFLAFTAGVCEEIIFRGYFINYGLWWANDYESQLVLIPVLLMPAISFGLAHLYQGWQAVVKIIVMAVLFGFFFIETGTIWPLMLIHIALDIVGGLVSWHLLSTNSGAG